ncbi:MAG TPA: acyl-CoA dehydrogenase, partial [Acidimicrobiales bacterium]|nr:acyl-CoA dehydrogenase [Acidimicrobiales bacterium]
VPEEHGGGSVSGAGVEDLALVAQVLGRHVFPGPVLPTNLVAAAVARAGSPEQRAEHLPAIASGEVIATWACALAGDRCSYDAIAVLATVEAGTVVLDGTVAPVQDAHVANLLLVTARSEGGLVNVLVPAAADGVTVVPLRSLDLARRFAEVRFERVRVPASAVLGDAARAADDVDAIFDLAVALQSAETVGTADRLFAMTLQYAKDRKAFGRPIGSFQALKHRLADMALWLESSRATAAAAVTAVQLGARSAEATSVAKSYIGEHAPLIARDCLQLHGGIGYTWEHDLHLYLRRIESNRALYGSPAAHLDRLAGLLGLGTEGSRPS